MKELKKPESDAYLGSSYTEYKGFKLDPTTNTKVAFCTLYRPFSFADATLQPSLKVGGALTFIAGFNQFTTATSAKPVTSGLSSPLT